MELTGKWVVATTLVICTAAVNAQDIDSGLENSAAAVPQGAQIKLPQDKITRYSAGDSIPLGGPAAMLATKPQASVPAVEAKPLPVQVKVVRYSAGDSIPLGVPRENHARGRVETATAAQKKAGFYSGASSIPLAGALGDSLTTHIGISQAGLAEANGFINTSPLGLVGLFVVKAGIVYYLEQQEPAVRKSGLKTAAGLWSGFTMNNLLLIAGSTNPVSLVGGALFGAYMYHREGIALEKESITKTAQGLHVQAP